MRNFRYLAVMFFAIFFLIFIPYHCSGTNVENNILIIKNFTEGLQASLVLLDASVLDNGAFDYLLSAAEGFSATRFINLDGIPEHDENLTKLKDVQKLYLSKIDAVFHTIDSSVNIVINPQNRFYYEEHITFHLSNIKNRVSEMFDRFNKDDINAFQNICNEHSPLEILENVGKMLDDGYSDAVFLTDFYSDQAYFNLYTLYDTTIKEIVVFYSLCASFLDDQQTETIKWRTKKIVDNIERIRLSLADINKARRELYWDNINLLVKEFVLENKSNNETVDNLHASLKTRYNTLNYSHAVAVGYRTAYDNQTGFSCQKEKSCVKFVQNNYFILISRYYLEYGDSYDCPKVEECLTVLTSKVNLGCPDAPAFDASILAKKAQDTCSLKTTMIMYFTHVWDGEVYFEVRMDQGFKWLKYNEHNCKFKMSAVVSCM